MFKNFMATRNGRKGNNNWASTSKIKRTQLEGGVNPEVAFIFKIRPNSVEESFKVQLFSRNDNFLGLIQNRQMYTGSIIQKEGNNEVKFKCVVNNNTALGISPGTVQGDRIMGGGVVFLTSESTIIISSSRSKAKDSNNLAKKYEAIGRIVNDNSSINGSAIQRILNAIEAVPPKSVSIVRCYLVTQAAR